MNGVSLIRFRSDEEGTFGTLRQNGQMLCYTCELPWHNNAPQKSCIPPGMYQVISFSSLKHPDVWQIVNVPMRTGILIHSGNTEADSLGCILVGDRLGTVNCLPAVLDSKSTMKMLKSALPESFEMTIGDLA